MGSTEERAKHEARKRRLRERAGKAIAEEFEYLFVDDGLAPFKISLTDRGYEWFGVFVAVHDSDGSEVVAFHTADTLAGLFIGFTAKLKKGDVRWRENKPWRPPEPKKD